ncbi:MAG: chloride channel protein EriC [Alphaproteobacteria bacterium]|nr:chloride channel protein EriC [Alphaproteobacteria bacterium]
MIADLHPRHRKLLFSGRRWRVRLVFWGGAIMVGLVSVAFAAAATQATRLFHLLLFNPLVALALTPLGFMLSVYLASRFFPGSQGSGIPQAIAARHMKDAGARSRLLSLKLTFGKILLTLFGMACGASIGREGPTVQVGAAILLQAGKIGRMMGERGLILAGAAAGVAAAFNTPLAGIVFAIEEMGRAFEQRNAGLVLIAVILAGVAALGMVGNYSYFGSNTSMLIVTIDWVGVVICGVAGGLAGAVFARCVLKGSSILRRHTGSLPRALMLAGSCGLIVAVCGLLSHGATYGTSYEAARRAVEGGHTAWSFAPLKFVATLASTLSGIPGGFFAPTLSIGAGLGDIIADLLHVHAPGAIVLLGMTAYFAGVVQAPITSAVIIGEMSNASAMRLPLLLAALIGYGVSRLFQRESLYHAMARDFLNRQKTVADHH